MNRVRAHTAWLAAAVLAIIGAAAAQVIETDLRETEPVFTQAAVAERWHLSVEEWTEYQRLMGGPRGIWSPALDPLTVLGIHATSDADRQRYAELLVMIEFERVEQELKFQQAYDVAAQGLFPDLPRIESVDTSLTASPFTPLLLDQGERLAFVGSVSSVRCPACQATLARVLEDRLGQAGAVLDLFLADAPDDAALQRWARTAGLDPTAVRDGLITLNHARPPFTLPAAASAVTPQLLRRRGGRWLAIESGP